MGLMKVCMQEAGMKMARGGNIMRISGMGLRKVSMMIKEISIIKINLIFKKLGRIGPNIGIVELELLYF